MITQGKILEYEVAASWWAQHIGSDFLQRLGGRYFAWKVRRKYRRYLDHFERQKRIAEMMALDEAADLINGTNGTNDDRH